jgi:Tol biopolymer transport system component
MSFKKTFILIPFILFIFIAFGFQNSSEHKVIFEKAKFTMETKGDLKGAIKLFEEIIKKYPDEREYAAKSQLYIGLCYEKLGMKQAKQAQKAFQKVIDNYPEQAEVVKVANEKLTVLSRAESVIEKGDKELKIQQVWSGPGVDICGAPSPDGRYLTYVDWGTGNLAIRELTTGKTRQLTKEGTWKAPREFALNSRISPDGKMVAYSWYNPQETYDLRLVGIDGSAPKILYSDNAYEAYPQDWSSDGKHIATFLYKKDDGAHQIIWVSVEDGSTLVLKRSLKGHSTASCVRHSPDDRYIAYDDLVDEGSGNVDIYLTAIDGSGDIPLVEHPANDRLLGWVPGGEEILFLSNRTGTWDAYVVRIADGKTLGPPLPVKRDIGQITPMGITRNGSFYFNIHIRYFTTHIAPFDLGTGKIQGQSSKPLLGSNFAPEWSPNGEFLAYVTEQRKGGPGFYHRPLRILNLKTGKERELASELSVGEPRWSPDGRYILVPGYDNTKSQEKDYKGGFYQIDANDGQVTTLVELDLNWFDSVAEWSADGKSIFYTNQGRLLERDLESGEEKQLYNIKNLSQILDLSPDGQRLVSGDYDPEEETLSLLIMFIQQQKVRELVKIQKVSRREADARWTPDGKYVVFMKYDVDEKGSSFWRVSSEGGEPQKLWQSKIFGGDMSIHPNGKQIAYTIFGHEMEIWVMENFLPEEKTKKK